VICYGKVSKLTKPENIHEVLDQVLHLCEMLIRHSQEDVHSYNVT
jgi:hypothetical protein